MAACAVFVGYMLLAFAHLNMPVMRMVRESLFVLKGQTIETPHRAFPSLKSDKI